MAVVLLVVTGCEHGVTLDVEIHIPPEAQEALSDEAPARIMLRAEIPKTSTIEYSLGILCRPSNEPVVVSMTHDGLGCAKQGMIQAWLAPVTPDGPTDECDLIQRTFSAGPIPTGAPQAMATVFEGNAGLSGCEDGRAQLELLLK